MRAISRHISSVWTRYSAFRGLPFYRVCPKIRAAVSRVLPSIENSTTATHEIFRSLTGISLPSGGLLVERLSHTYCWENKRFKTKKSYWTATLLPHWIRVRKKTPDTKDRKWEDLEREYPLASVSFPPCRENEISETFI
jgi:hypothetical protein